MSKVAGDDGSKISNPNQYFTTPIAISTNSPMHGISMGIYLESISSSAREFNGSQNREKFRNFKSCPLDIFPQHAHVSHTTPIDKW